MFETKARGFSLKCVKINFVVQYMTTVVPSSTFSECQDFSQKNPKIIYLDIFFNITY